MSKTYEKPNVVHNNCPQKSTKVDHHNLEKNGLDLLEQIWTVLTIVGILFMLGFCIFYKFYLKRKSKDVASRV